jgi:hypothetical protein
MSTTFRSTWLHAALVVSCLPFALASTAGAQLPKLSPELERIRAALDKYQDPVVAIHDGYFSTLGCMEYPIAGKPGQAPYPAGGMGVHFFNTMISSTTPDPLRPNVLLYEPVGEKLRLVAAEWFVPLATGVKERPTLFGVQFDGPMMGHRPLMPDGLHHYDLHVWLWKENPAGLFRPTNPSVRCGTYPFAFREPPPMLVAGH